MQWSAVGHDEQKQFLQGLLDGNGLGHALLFTGPEGIGKRMVAEDIAGVLVPRGYELDAMRLAPVTDDDGAVHDITIEAVRDMKQWLALTPVGAHKVVLIDDADRLGGEAANTLLKVLEEPPAYAHFILISGRPQALLTTITSRCLQVGFRPLTTLEMKEVLAQQRLDEDDVALLATVANGRPGVALKLLQTKQLPTVARHIAALEKALTVGVAAKLIYAKEVADSDHASDIVSWWLAYVQSRLTERPGLAPVAHGLVDLYQAVSQSQFNTRLAVEHFLLEIPFFA